MAPSGGTLGLSVSNGTLDLTAASAAYHGPTNITNTALTTNSELLVSALPNSSIVNINSTGAVLGFVGANTNISTPINNLGTIVFSGGSGTLSGAINGGKLVVAAGGPLALTGTDTVPGTVWVSGGGTLNAASGCVLNILNPAIVSPAIQLGTSNWHWRL